MKLSTTFVALSTFASFALVSSSSLLSSVVSNVTDGDLVMQNSSSSSVGAAYFITNDPEINYVVSADIASDGRLTLARAVLAGGRGSHDDAGTPTPGPDSLFSQGCVEASASGKILAAVNPGSNTLAVFTINPDMPSQISMIGHPVPSGGEFPISVAINKDGNEVCVLNGGAVNGVNCYTVDSKSGLTVKPNTLRALNVNQTTPANGPAGSLSQVIFSEDGKYLVASIKGIPPTPGFLALWDIMEDGILSQNLTKVYPGQGGLLPFSMTPIPGTTAILATDAGVGFDIFDLSNIQEASNSSKTTVIPIAGQSATCWSSYSPKTGNFYLTDIGTSIVTEVNVDQNLKGSIVKQYPQMANSATIDNDIASINGNDFFYVLQPNSTSIQVLSLDAPGEATALQTVDIAGPAKRVGLPIDKVYLGGMTIFLKD